MSENQKIIINAEDEKDEAEAENENEIEDKGEADAPELPDEIPADLFALITKPLDEMNDDELHKNLLQIRAMRKVKIASGKRDDSLNKMLKGLSPALAQQILEKLEAKFGKAEDGEINIEAASLEENKEKEEKEKSEN